MIPNYLPNKPAPAHGVMKYNRMTPEQRIAKAHEIMDSVKYLVGCNNTLLADGVEVWIQYLTRPFPETFDANDYALEECVGANMMSWCLRLKPYGIASNPGSQWWKGVLAHIEKRVYRP